ncbi:MULTISPECIES: efflux RND transporter periplasmic adaptor subunit [unclassified Azospirillum]|uniref:efflux RND transporter periplasmic adaptor subunit n=1 Tax=unclassified Azospirillum TaxID=2630922 RepID=UPI000B747702|nr:MULTISPECIES: efflux RND transporter periplasmic adaptor subunit [unclassified Azospirillum]SNS75377.1 RND family efflux transporter, MFP subunit [Azospirillum sp. RU38E]SNS92536.1 RND family efflux transporter, MFP subunit [Azospirillum sp. RU37A]
MRTISCFLLALLLVGPAAAETVASFRGITEPARDLSLGVPVDGIVRDVPVKEGDSVKAGAPLLRLDARLEELEVKRRQILRDDGARLEATRQRRDILEGLLNSARSLYKGSGSISETELRRTELEYLEAAAAVRSLEADRARSGVEYDIAKSDFDRRTVTSPINGVVVSVMVDTGERVRRDDAVVRVVDQSICIFTVNVEEPFARAIKLGDKGRVEVMSGEQVIPVEARVTFVSPVADPASGLVKMKLEFANPDGRVRPGLPGRIALQRPDGPPADKPE